MKSLIVDCGATSCKFCVLDKNEIISEGQMPGFSPLLNQFSSFPDFSHVVEDCESILFFGTACIGENQEIVKKLLSSQFGTKRIEVGSDLEAAALACCGSVPGYVHIIGTGSAVNLWDGRQMTNPKVNLGFLWEDYASGFDITKTIVRYWNEGKLSAKENELLEAEFSSVKDFIDMAYNSQDIKMFVASSSLILRSLTLETQKLIINERLDLYFDKNIDIFAADFEHHFVGSLAHFMKAEIEERMKARSLKTGKIIKNTIRHLCNYYKEKSQNHE